MAALHVHTLTVAPQNLPSMSVASHRHTSPKAPWPSTLKNFNRCRGNSHRSDFNCELAVAELLVESCDVACVMSSGTALCRPTTQCVCARWCSIAASVYMTRVMCGVANKHSGGKAWCEKNRSKQMLVTARVYKCVRVCVGRKCFGLSSFWYRLFFGGVGRRCDGCIESDVYCTLLLYVALRVLRSASGAQSCHVFIFVSVTWKHAKWCFVQIGKWIELDRLQMQRYKLRALSCMNQYYVRCAVTMYNIEWSKYCQK